MEEISVQVALRVRPILPHEGDASTCVEVPLSVGASKQKQIKIGKGEDSKTFTFDHVFDQKQNQVGTCIWKLTEFLAR